MSVKPKALLSRSSGKDSAWALHVLNARDDIEIVGLLSVLTRPYGRVTMHAVREELLDAQAAATGLPLMKISIPSPCSNEEYEAAMAKAMEGARASGITVVAFGDLYLDDVRRYREDRLALVGMKAEFPLWGRDTGDLAHEMVLTGLRAIVTCVDPKQLSPAFAGRTCDESFLDDLPEGVDPCGEHGEFHTFAYAGPMFSKPIPVVVGEVVERDGFVFTDVKLDSDQ